MKIKKGKITFEKANIDSINIIWLIIWPAIFIFFFGVITQQKNEDKDNTLAKFPTSIVEVDYNILKSSLSDSCSFSGATLECSKNLMSQLLKDVDSSSVKKIKDDEVTFFKKGAYINIPASIMANMIDLQLIKNKDNND